MTRFLAKLVASFLVAFALQSPAARAAEPAPNLWQQMFRQDLAFAHETIRTRYIYARTPGGAEWDRLLAAADKQADADAEKVTDFFGYQAALRRYTAAFADAHLSVRLDIQPARVAWPKFLVRYQSGRYVVVESLDSRVAVGSAVTACDGRLIEAFVGDLAPPLGKASGGEDGSLYLESTRVSVARSLFVDNRNPFYHRPQHCRIGDADVDLVWTQIDAEQFAKLNAPYDLLRDPVTAISDFGKNSARVRIATFAPSTPEEAKQFHAIIEAAPGLRDKEVVVFDVRGNGGGNYNWFVAFLEAFYGTDYADHYAIARLKIRPVFIDPPDGGHPAASAKAEPAQHVDPFNTPPDRPMDELLNAGYASRPAADGTTVYAATLGSLPAAALKPAPPSLVHARVFVLTDYGCASACISFVDELRRFPGAEQVGRETGVDSRSGTPLPYPLPSGNGILTVPSLVREDRERGDNIPWRPDIRYEGDIADTAAVLAWIQTLPPASGHSAQ
jgi:Peptidase family S41